MDRFVVLRKTSLVDYPGRVAAVLFFPGCNLRCPWCHNAGLVDPADSQGETAIDVEEALAILERRRRVLGGVVLSGGEPLLRSDLAEILQRIKELGLSVKVDTNGTLPDRLQTLLSRPETTPSFVAVDLKIAPNRYAELGERDAAVALRRTAELLRASGTEHEFRTLVLPAPHFGEADLRDLAAIAESSPWSFSAFSPGNCLDPAWNAYPRTPKAEVERWVATARNLGAAAAARGA